MIVVGLIALALGTWVGVLLGGICSGNRLASERRRAYIAGVCDGAERMKNAAIEAVSEMAAEGRLLPGPQIPASDEVRSEPKRRGLLP